MRDYRSELDPMGNETITYKRYKRKQERRAKWIGKVDAFFNLPIIKAIGALGFFIAAFAMVVMLS